MNKNKNFKNNEDDEEIVYADPVDPVVPEQPPVDLDDLYKDDD